MEQTTRPLDDQELHSACVEAVGARLAELGCPQQGFDANATAPAEEVALDLSKPLREQILLLKEGPAIDSLIAERVMEFRSVGKYTFASSSDDIVHIYTGPYGAPEAGWTEEFYPSRDITHAWQVVEFLIKKGFRFEVRRRGVGTHEPPWSAVFNSPGRRGLNHASGATAAEAICKAALLQHFKQVAS